MMSKMIYAIAFAAALLAAAAVGVSAQDQAPTDTRGTGALTVPSQPTLPATTTQNTIQTTSPVRSETTISVGTIAGEVLTWIAAAFSVPIGGLLTVLLMRVFKMAGVQVTDQQKAQLQSIVVNGLNAAAANTTKNMAGQNPINIKNQTVAEAIDYVQAHGADTIKALGLDPHSGEAVEAIKARIETAINDPSVPTPPVLAPEVQQQAQQEQTAMVEQAQATGNDPSRIL